MMLNHGDMKKLMNPPFKNMGTSLLKAVFLSLLMMVMPGLAGAAQINSVSLMESDQGDTIRIEADASLEYQVFDLDGPPRMVINFPGATISDDVSAIKSGGNGVTNIFPMKKGNEVRLEIGLSEATGYKIEESGNALIVHFAGTAEKAGQPASAAVIKDIEVRDTGTATELVLRGENMDANHNAFLSNQDQTLILDFWGGISKLPKEFYQYSTQRIRNVVVGEAEGRVRLVVGLIPGGQVNQQIDADAGQMTVRFGNIEPARKAESIAVESVDFQPDDRIAHIMVRTDAVDPIININEKDGNVIIDLKKAHLAAGQERSQDVRAFPGPVKQIDSYGIDDGVRIVARLRDKVDVTSFQQGNVVTINFEPEDLYLARTGALGGGKGESAYTGQKVTFDFKDIEITNALKLISEMSNLNIIMSDDVKGSLTMRLVDVPWDQALDIILSSQGLGKVVEGNVMRIAPLAVLRKEHKEALEGIKDVEMLEPLITEPIALSFARVDEIKGMLDASRQVVQAAGEAGGAGEAATTTGSAAILSPRGSYLVDQRTNTLIVTDTEQAINNVKRFISIVDKSVEQVLIEARVVEATDSFTDEFGIRWGGQFSSNRTALSGAPNIQVGATNPTARNGFLVDLPALSSTASGGAIGVSWGAISKMLNLDLELSAAEVDGTAKIVSSPRILTANGGKALIAQGQEVPYVTPASGNSPATVEFKRAWLKLEVTPQITANKTVIMEVDITKDAPTGETVLGNPILATKKVTTNLQVKDGETIVIGGIFTRDTNNNESGVPGLKEIPLLGWLFKTKSKTDDKTELLIFLTPSIVKGSGAKAGTI